MFQGKRASAKTQERQLVPRGSQSAPGSVRSVRSLLFVLAFVAAGGSVAPAFAQRGASSADTLAFAGVGYLTNAADIENRFPVARTLESLAAASGRKLSDVLLETMRRAGIPVSAGESRRLGKAVAFAFEDEYQITEPLAGSFKVITVLTGQLLIFDYEEMQVLSSFPVTYEYVDAQRQPPAADYSRAVARTLLADFQNGAAGGVFPSTIATFQTLAPSAVSGCRVKVGVVQFDTSMTRATALRFSGDAPRLERALASVISRAWVTASRMPLLPNGGSQIVNNQMALQFADSRVFDLKVPEADYDLVFGDMKVRQSVLGSNGAVRVDGTGIQANVRVTVPVDGSVRAAGQFRQVMQDTVPVSKSVADGWPAVANTLKSMAAQLATAARQGDAKWFGDHDVAKTSFPKLPEWIKKCAP